MTTLATQSTPQKGDVSAAFRRALQKKRVAEALQLIDAGANVTATGEETSRFPPVRLAIETGAVELVQAIITAGNINIHDTDEHGWALLHYAARDGQADIITALIGMGADIEQPTAQTDWTPLHVAALHGATAATERLLEHGAKANATAPRKDGNTPLHNAAARGRIDDVMTLLAHGADPRKTNDEGFTPRDFAVMQNQLHAAAKLLDYLENMDLSERLIRIKALRRQGPTIG